MNIITSPTRTGRQITAQQLNIVMGSLEHSTSMIYDKEHIANAINYFLYEVDK